MSEPRRQRHSQLGMTMIEIMVVVAIVLTFTVIGFPMFNDWIDRSRFMGYTSGLTNQLVMARQEAIRRSSPVVAQPDLATGTIRIHVNVDDDAGLAYNEDLSAVVGTVDVLLGLITFPGNVDMAFKGPAAGEEIDGLTAMAAGDNAIVFDVDGSVRNVGGIRFGDDRGNLIELRVEPAATGRITVRKYNPSPGWGGAAGYFERGNHNTSGEPTWVWQ